MRITPIILISVLIHFAFQQQNQFTFPDLDREMLSLWLGLKQGENRDYEKQVLTIKNEWSKVLDIVDEEYIEHFDYQSFIERQGLLMNEIVATESKEDYEALEFFTHQFMWEFKKIREAFTNDSYPLDDLWQVYDMYEQVRFVVNDPMLGLYEWNEFIGLYEDFKKEYLEFKQKSKTQLEQSNFSLYQTSIEKVEQCIAEFEISLETAQKTDIEMPCNEIGLALLDLFAVYT